MFNSVQPGMMGSPLSNVGTTAPLRPAPPCRAGEPIAYVAETEVELAEAAAKAAGGASSNGAAAAPAPVEAAAPVTVRCYPSMMAGFDGL